VPAGFDILNNREAGKVEKIVATVQRIFGNPKAKSVAVQLDNGASLVVGQTVYVQQVGYFLLTNVNTVVRNTRVKLKFLEKNPSDNLSLQVGQSVVPAGARGSPGLKGEKGDSSIAILKKTSESFFILPDEINPSKRDSTELKLKIARVKRNGIIIGPTNILESNTVIKVSQECKKGKVLIGNCRWEIFKFDNLPSWCLAEDFPVGKRGCSDCISSVETNNVYFEGGSRNVATKITYSNSDQSNESYDLNDSSCSILETQELDSGDISKCGFFCFFQKLDSLYESETKFTCRFIPPTAFGFDLSSPFFAGTDLHDKIQSITIEVVCS